MAKKILVYENLNTATVAGRPVAGTALGGWYCEHAVVVAKKKGDVVLCEECLDAADAGAEIVKAAKAGK